MKLQTVLLAAAAGFAAAQNFTRCGTSHPSAEHRAVLNEAYFSKVADISKNVTQNVNTYVHVVSTQESRSKYTKAMVQKQMKVMNEAYKPLGVSFSTQNITFTINADWASAAAETATELEMKTSLRQGTYADLNLYFQSDMSDGLLGICYFPTSNPTNQDIKLDGCMCHADSMPNGTISQYNLGYTAVHETGHWFGLYHVFGDGDGTCTGAGDYVNDTPMQGVATTGCPKNQDSCPNQKGKDSIHNFMDYSTDECMYEFSDGQVDRALAGYMNLREGK